MISVKDELAGKTGMSAKDEKELFERITLIENEFALNGYIVKPLEKKDYAVAIILFAISILILPIVKVLI